MLYEHFPNSPPKCLPANNCLWVSQDYRIEYPAAFVLEVAASMTEVLQGPQEVDEGGVRGRIRCISTQLENEVSHVESITVMLPV